MAGPSNLYSSMDFDVLKNTFKSYLRGQDRFKDYDFSGSNINVLLDLLAYNTNMNAFYLNMVGNEMFLDSAQLRDSVVSHAKELNYVPRSFTSSKAIVDIRIVSNSPTKRNISIPKGTTFTARTVDSNGAGQNYTFSTDRNIVLTEKVEQTDTTATFIGRNIELFEGTYIQESYSFINGQAETVKITNQTVDASSIRVSVLEDSGATTLAYSRVDSLFGLNEDSQVFFIQGSENYSYELLFGDGVIGRRPKNNSIIVVEYRICNGELPNGLSNFMPDGTIDSETDITITAHSKSYGGAVAEDLDSIKFNAPRAFTTQERAVTSTDFENLLKRQFPEINAVSAYGGEMLDPPQYGKVFVAVDLKETDILPRSKKDEYYNFLKPRSIVSIDPEFVDPDYVYIAIDTHVNYNVNITPINADDVRTLVLTAISNFTRDNLDNFNKTLRYSKLVNAIDSSSGGVVSNETNIIGLKRFTPMLNTAENYRLNFGYAFKLFMDSVGDRELPEENIITSTYFTYENQLAFMKDDGQGNLLIVAQSHQGSQDELATLANIGTVDYENGVIYINSFIINRYEGAAIKIYAKPRSRDITSSKDIILNILDEDVAISITAIRD